MTNDELVFDALAGYAVKSPFRDKDGNFDMDLFIKYTMPPKDARYKIIDKDGVEMPDHYSGRLRTYEEVKKIVDRLNQNGEYRPYKMVKN